MLCPVHQFLFEDGFLALLHGLDESGPIRHIDMVASSAGADGGGAEAAEQVMADILPHPLSLMRRILGPDLGDVAWAAAGDQPGEVRAMATCAGATLGGEHIYALDNQGTCVVLEPGPVFKPLAANRIETVIQRDWPVPPQEIIANGAPVFDGKYMYLRGERHLYCIGDAK